MGPAGCAHRGQSLAKKKTGKQASADEPPAPSSRSETTKSSGPKNGDKEDQAVRRKHYPRPGPQTRRAKHSYLFLHAGGSGPHWKMAYRQASAAEPPVPKPRPEIKGAYGQRTETKKAKKKKAN